MDSISTINAPVPAPSEPKRGDVLIELPPSIAAKVLLLNAMLAQQVTPAELARRLNTRRQEINRVIDLEHRRKSTQSRRRYRPRHAPRNHGDAGHNKACKPLLVPEGQPRRAPTGLQARY